MSNLDTEQWEFYAHLGYKLKPQPQITCTDCQGRGKIGGGWADPNDPEPCWKCSRTGVITQPTTEPRPEIPQSLVQHMKKAFNEWYDGNYPEAEERK